MPVQDRVEGFRNRPTQRLIQRLKEWGIDRIEDIEKVWDNRPDLREPIDDLWRQISGEDDPSVAEGAANLREEILDQDRAQPGTAEPHDVRTEPNQQATGEHGTYLGRPPTIHDDEAQGADETFLTAEQSAEGEVFQFNDSGQAVINLAGKDHGFDHDIITAQEFEQMGLSNRTRLIEAVFPEHKGLGQRIMSGSGQQRAEAERKRNELEDRIKAKFGVIGSY